MPIYTENHIRVKYLTQMTHQSRKRVSAMMKKKSTYHINLRTRVLGNSWTAYIYTSMCIAEGSQRACKSELAISIYHAAKLKVRR